MNVFINREQKKGVMIRNRVRDNNKSVLKRYSISFSFIPSLQTYLKRGKVNITFNKVLKKNPHFFYFIELDW